MNGGCAIFPQAEKLFRDFFRAHLKKIFKLGKEIEKRVMPVFNNFLNPVIQDKKGKHIIDKLEKDLRRVLAPNFRPVVRKLSTTCEYISVV